MRPNRIKQVEWGAGDRVGRGKLGDAHGWVRLNDGLGEDNANGRSEIRIAAENLGTRELRRCKMGKIPSVQRGTAQAANDD